MPDHATLRSRSLPELVQTARSLNIENPAGLRKPELVAAILRVGNAPAEGAGVLEILPDGFGFLRAPEYAYLQGPDDVYVSPSQIRRFNLRSGDAVSGQVRAPKENERYFALVKVGTVNGVDPEVARDRMVFENLPAGWPDRRLALPGGPLARLVDRLAPLGRGQRALVRGQSRAGKSAVLRELARALHTSGAGLDVSYLLIAGRPEEAHELETEAPHAVLATTFDEPETRHVQVVDMATERARRLAEHQRDVVLVVDTLNAVARAGNATTPATGHTLPGGLDVAALARVRRLLATARAIPSGGSVTVLAGLQTGSVGDEALAAELAGYENWLLPLLPGGAELPRVDLEALRTEGRFLDAAAAAEVATWRRRVAEDPGAIWTP